MIRPALASDLPALVRLTAELGYASAPEAVARRLELILANPAHAVFVTETAGAGVVGWLHVGINPLLESDPRAEIYGLVIDPEHRHRGLGAQLVAQAVAWAEARGLTGLRVRSNVKREDAHRFYRREGFAVTKTQVVLDRACIAPARRTEVRPLPQENQWFPG